MIVAGTRPEVIKLAPVIEWLNRMKVDCTFIWSGQHYDYEMSNIFFEQLKLPEPHENLGVKGVTHAEQTGKIMIKLEKVVDRYRPSVILSQGDTNTVVAASLTASKKLIPFAHLEAGLRSWDRTMPEETNRIVADAVAEVHFAPTELAAINLMHEGVLLKKIHITGNTIIDMVLRYKKLAIERGRKILNKMGIEPNRFFLATVHRQENTDYVYRLTNIVKAFTELSKQYHVVFVVHPRTEDRLRRYNLINSLSKSNMKIIKPLGYLDFLGLIALSRVVLTDSGGVQEEAFTLGVPTVTLRYNTERPETVLLGGNTLVGTEFRKIVSYTLVKAEEYDKIHKKIISIKNPFGNGEAGKKIAYILKNIYDTGVHTLSVDTRSDPFITFSIINSRLIPKEQVLALYDNNGLAVSDYSKSKTALIRAPLSHLIKLLNKDKK